MKIYPAYYRKGSVCIKRENPLRGKQVDLSEQASANPFKLIETEDKSSFDELVSSMELVSNETYERYLIILHNKSKHEAKTFREAHERSPEFYGQARPRSFFE